MSDLVEKVARAIAEHTDCGVVSCPLAARAAIAAVLEHLADNVSDEMVFAAIAPDEPNMAHFKDAFRGTIEGARKEISAALRAAAEGSE